MTIPEQAASSPWGSGPPSDRDRAAYAEAEPVPFWLDSPDAPPPSPGLDGREGCELAVVGGGLSGLWAALQAKEDDPGRDVVLIEGERIAHAASGRNGGFFSSSLTHGLSNGLSRFADEMPALERLGLANFDGAVETIRRLGIDCDLELEGDIAVALAAHESGWLAEEASKLSHLGHDVELFDGERMRDEVRSPTYRSGMWQRSGSGTLDPAKLCWGLRRAALEMGVRIYERSPVDRLHSSGSAVRLVGPSATLDAEAVVLATSAFPGLVPEIRRRIVPVYDYVLVTEPLSDTQRSSLGWRRRQGVSDSANQFHYYRLTADDRVLWGGYDAIYHFGNGLRPELEQRDRSFARLSRHFFITFPQLEGIRFSHRWGGAIDTCSRFFAFNGLVRSGRVAYTVGHTGLGVGASRFGARMALDLLDGRRTEATRLKAIRSRPFPFPPEPLRWASIELTRSRLAAADRRQGRRGLWLRMLDRLGLGYDS